MSETLNWIGSLNPLCNFVRHICSSVCITVFWPFRNHVSGTPFFLFFSLLVFPCFFFFFFSFPCLFFYWQLFPWPLISRTAGCVVSAHLMGLLQKLSCLPSQRNAILSTDHTTWSDDARSFLHILTIFIPWMDGVWGGSIFPLWYWVI